MPTEGIIAAIAMFGTFSVLVLALGMLKTKPAVLPALEPVIVKTPLKDYRVIKLTAKPIWEGEEIHG
jgi:hypothetical protein